MADKSLLNLGKIYGDILNNVPVVKESNEPNKAKQISPKIGKKEGPGAEELTEVGDKTSILGNEDSSGPDNADNYIQPDEKNNEEDEETVRKSVNSTINKFMANKSVFDKLFESVMNEDSNNELNELGINPEQEGSNPFGSEVEGEGEGEGEVETEGEVTITLNKDLAKKLHDVLMQVLGEDEGEAEAEGEVESESEGEVESEGEGEEDEETLGGVDVRKNSVDTGKNNKVGTTTGSAAAAANDGSYTTGDGSLKPAPKYDDGKNNKVNASRIKPGSFANK